MNRMAQPRLRTTPIAALCGFALATSLFLPAPPAGAEIDPDLLELKPATMKLDPELRTLREAWIDDLKDPGSAREHFDKVRALVAENPQDVDLVRHYIRVSRQSGTIETVRGEVEANAEIFPDDPASHYFLGLLEEGEDAAEEFERALELKSGFYYALVGLAGAHLTSDDPAVVAEAKTILLRAARTEPAHPLAFLYLAEFYRREGDADSRVAAIENAATSDPQDPLIRQSLLQSLQQLGQIAQKAGASEEWADRAGSVLRRIGTIGEGDASLLHTSGRVWGGVGNIDEAIRSLEMAADHGFYDLGVIESDRALQSVIRQPSFAPIREKIKSNRKDHAPEIKREIAKQLISTPLPRNIEFPLLDGGKVRLDDLRGKVVVLDFWATWCGPCRKALPVLQTFYAEKPKDVEVFCVNVFERDGGKKVSPFWEKGAYPMPVALGSKTDAAAFGVTSIPTLIVIDPAGKIRYNHRGFSPDLAEMLGWITEILLEETP